MWNLIMDTFQFEVLAKHRPRKKVGYKAGLWGQSLEEGFRLRKHSRKVLTWAESRREVSVSLGTAQVRRWGQHPGNQSREGGGGQREGGGGLVREMPGRRRWQVMPRPWGWEVEIRRAGQRKTLPGSFQQERGRGGLDGIASEVRKQVRTLFRNVQQWKEDCSKGNPVKFLFTPTSPFFYINK